MTEVAVVGAGRSREMKGVGGGRGREVKLLWE